MRKSVPSKCFLVAVLAAAWLPSSALGQAGAAGGEWRHHGGDQGSTKYSALSQIDSENFSRLEVAWRWESADSRLGDDVGYQAGHFRATPLVVGGVMYAATSHGQVAALDPGTGKELWVYDPRSYTLEKPTINPLQTRGIEYWTDGTQERILIATLGKQLISIDTKTGRPDPEFGEDGIVDLRLGLGLEGRASRNIAHGAPPIVVGDTIVVGSKIFDYLLRDNSPPGHIRGYDVRSGELKWRFNTIPQEGEKFTETWENDSWKTAGNTNAWSMLSADQELGYVYLPLGTGTNDYYGGERHGDNVYAESLLCLDAETGERIWHFQTVHHGIWDYDIASAPNLIDFVHEGRLVKAVAQVSKTGFTYVFDRRTGEPLWPIEERPVPSLTSVPGEKLATTQPFPTKPPPFERIGVGPDDLIDFTPELRQEALEIAKDYVLGPIFTPLIVKGHGGKLATLVVPGAAGGANFPGASIDPDTGYLFVPSQTRPIGMALVEPDSARSDWKYVIDYARLQGPQGLPIIKPPYRRITAIDLKTGEHAWQIPHGQGPTEHPAIKHLNLGPLGSPYPRVVAEGGLLVTKTLLITYLGKLDELGDRTPSATVLQAFDKATGELLAEVEIDGWLHGPPMTYLHEGRQFFAVAAGGGSEKGELVAVALPTED
jgi:quinoprotein glucose dehydrogenase